jgi:hypothetical protein
MDRNEPGTLSISKARNKGLEEFMGLIEIPNTSSAFTPGPGGTVRSFDPPDSRDVIVVTAPHDHPLRQLAAAYFPEGIPGISICHQESPWNNTYSSHRNHEWL